MKNPEYVSAKRICLYQCSRPTHDFQKNVPYPPTKIIQGNKGSSNFICSQEVTSEDLNASVSLVLRTCDILVLVDEDQVMCEK